MTTLVAPSIQFQKVTVIMLAFALSSQIALYVILTATAKGSEKSGECLNDLSKDRWGALNMAFHTVFLITFGMTSIHAAQEWHRYLKTTKFDGGGKPQHRVRAYFEGGLAVYDTFFFAHAVTLVFAWLTWSFLLDATMDRTTHKCYGNKTAIENIALLAAIIYTLAVACQSAFAIWMSRVSDTTKKMEDTAAEVFAFKFSWACVAQLLHSSYIFGVVFYYLYLLMDGAYCSNWSGSRWLLALPPLAAVVIVFYLFGKPKRPAIFTVCYYGLVSLSALAGGLLEADDAECSGDVDGDVDLKLLGRLLLYGLPAAGIAAILSSKWASQLLHRGKGPSAAVWQAGVAGGMQMQALRLTTDEPGRTSARLSFV